MLTDYVGMLQQKLREEWDWPGREAAERAARAAP
jgi:hypothetical protein